LCAPWKAWEKGGVECAIRFLRERFLAARQIVSVEQGNRALRAFIDEIAHPRAHERDRSWTWPVSGGAADGLHGAVVEVE
jgi:hypothetical protein